MELFQNEPVITKITAALFVAAGSGTPVHINRSAHGLAFNTAHTTVYRFRDGQVLTCHPGQIIYLPRGSSYTVDRTAPSADPAAGSHAVNFQLEKSLREKPFLLTPRSRSDILGIYTHIEKAWRVKRPGDREQCFSLLYRLLAVLGQEQEHYASPSRVMTRLSPAVHYIQEHLTEPLTAPQLAELCGVSEPYLRRLFHSAFGMSPMVYVRQLRLQYARELLATGEYSVSHAATASGFNDLAYFSRAYKQTFGQVPSQGKK